MEANGTASRDRLKEARRRVREKQMDLEAKRLERSAQLLEAVSDGGLFDWVQAYSTLLDRFTREPGVVQMNTLYDRRWGRNFPLYQTEQELALIRMPSRILCGTNPYAQGLLAAVCAYVVGEGYQYRAIPKGQTKSAAASAPHEDQPLADAVQEIIDDFCRRNEWGGGVRESLEEELLVRSLEDGEFFLDHVRNDDGSTTIRTIEPEQVRQPTQNQDAYATWYFGIKTPVDDAQSVQAFNVVWGGNVSDSQEIDAADVTHFKRNVKRSIKRGFPDFSFGTHEALSLSDKLRKNMQVGSAIQAALAEIRQFDNANLQQVTNLQNMEAVQQAVNQITGQQEAWARRDAGTRLDIPKGFTYVAPPAYANAQSFVDILHAGLRGAARRWLMPDYLSTGSGEDVAAYTGANAMSIGFIVLVKQNQKRYKEAFLRSLWIAVRNKLAGGPLAVIRKTGDGTLVSNTSVDLEEIRRKIDIQVEAPNPVHKDELNEAQANQIRSQAKVLSPQTWMMNDGLDPEQEMTNWEEWDERMGPTLPELELPPGEQGDAPPHKEPAKE